MEKLIKNAFVSPKKPLSLGVDYSDDLVIETELIDRVVPGPSGDSSDFIIVKEPVEVNRYHLNKVLQERAKGCDLASIVSRCEKTGDYSILNAREVSYGDGFVQPENASDLLQRGVETSEFLDSLSAEEKELYIKLAHLPDEKLKEYIDSLKQKDKAVEPVKEEENK